jgi:CPA1 family monovalent cation:H+ antiporter
LPGAVGVARGRHSVAGVSILRNIPYTLLLLLVGLGLAVLDVRLINLSPQLILFIFLPPLLFEAAWNLNWKRLKQYAVPVVLYAVLGVVICVGSLVWGLQPLRGIPGDGAAGRGQSVGD